MIDEENDPYRNLAEAIVDAAIVDYLKVFKHKNRLKVKIKEYKKNINKLCRLSTIDKYYKQIEKLNESIMKDDYEIQSIETFIMSKWFTQLTNRDPETLLGKLKEEVEKYDSKRIPKPTISN